MLGLTLWSARSKANRLPLLMGWGWWFLASLLVSAPLETSYLLHGPRLLYLGSAGLALLWPILLEPVYELPGAGRLIWAVSLVIVLAVGWFYIKDRLEAYDRLTEPVDTVTVTMHDEPTDEGIMMVNLPQWLAPPKNTYPVGVEFVAMMDGYLFIEELITENLLGDRPAQAIMVPDLMTFPAYTYDVHEEPAGELLSTEWSPAGSSIFITSYTENGPLTRYTGKVGQDTGRTKRIASFGPYDLLEVQALMCENEVNLTTTWRLGAADSVEEDISPTTSIFAQMLDEGGVIIDQGDGPLLNLRPDILNLAPGWVVTDERILHADDMAEGQILIGAYDFMSGNRFTAQDEAGDVLPDNALTVPLQMCS